MRRAFTIGIAILLVSNAIVVGLSPILMRYEAGYWACAAVQLGSSVAASFVAALLAPKRNFLLGLSLLAPASILWVLANMAYAVNGVGTDFGNEAGTVIVGVLSFGVNLVLCSVGADVGEDVRAMRQNKSGMGVATSDAGSARGRPSRRVVGWLGVIGGLALSLFIALMLQLDYGRPKANIWILPDGCVGWVQVDYGVPGAPALPIEDGYGVVRVPLGGWLQTSSAVVASPSREQYWYERGGRRVPGPLPIAGGTMQTGEAARAQSPKITVYSFFGTAEDMKGFRSERDRNDLPSPKLIKCRLQVP